MLIFLCLSQAWALRNLRLSDALAWLSWVSMGTLRCCAGAPSGHRHDYGTLPAPRQPSELTHPRCPRRAFVASSEGARVDPSRMELTLAVRRQVTKAQVERYRKGTKSEKGAVLDALTLATGWHRDHARKALRSALSGHEPPARAARAPRYTYPPESIEALVKCWAVLGGPAGKVLAPALPDLVPSLLRHGELDLTQELAVALASMSAATIDRRLRPCKIGLVAGKGRSMTKPGTLLKSSIPMKTWHEWDDTAPGFIEIDLGGVIAS